MTNENGTKDRNTMGESGTDTDDDDNFEGSHGRSRAEGSGSSSRPGSRPISDAGPALLPGRKSPRPSAHAEGSKDSMSEEKHLTRDFYDHEDVKEELIPGIPEVWYRPNGGKKVLVRRMINDLCRKGNSDGEVMQYLVDSYDDLLQEFDIASDKVRAVRAKMELELASVPAEFRPQYRDAMVKSVGIAVAPWDLRANPIGSTRLELGKISMTELPGELLKPPYTSQIKVMILSSNLLRSVGKEYSKFKELSQLMLDHNQIEILHPHIGRLRWLKLLTLNHNQLKIVPWEIGQLVRLETLYLNHNQIEYMPITLGRLTNMKDLKLGNNPGLKCPPPHIISKQANSKAQVDFLRLLDTGDMSGALRLRNLELKTFPTEILNPILFYCLRVAKSTLTSLDLGNNNIPAIADTYQIFEETYSVGQQLSGLRNLSLSNNTFKLVPHAIVLLSQLTSLNIEGNDKITSLPVELCAMTNLTELRATIYREEGEHGKKAQFVSPPLPVLENGVKAAVWDKETGELKAPGSAEGVIFYLQRIQEAKTSLKLYHNNMHIDTFCPELNEAASEPQGNAEVVAHKNAMNAMFSEGIGNLLNMEYMYYHRNQLTKLPKSIGILTRLVHLCADHNKLAAIPDHIGSLVKLRELSVSFNRIKALPNVIGKLSSLLRLGLNHNCITELPRSLGKCFQLEVLRLDTNQIKEFPDTVSELSSLITLSLSNNFLISLPESIANLTGLVHLRAENNAIVGLPATIGGCCGLCEIDLRGNSIIQLPPTMGMITALRILRLEGNAVEFPPPEVLVCGAEVVREFLNRTVEGHTSNYVNLSNQSLLLFLPRLLEWAELVSIDLSYNELREIPSEIGGLRNLEILRFQNNRLEWLPDMLGDLEWLESLHVDNNRIKELPAAIANLDRLTDLTLEFNKLSKLPIGLGALLNLKTFTISDNPLIEPPAEVVQSEHGSGLVYNYLQSIFDSMTSNVLVMDGIGLSTLPLPVLDNPHMEGIHLSSNMIENISPDISRLKMLRELHLSKNKIQRMPEELGGCMALRILDLSCNCITKLDAVVLSLKRLKILDMSRNSITSVPQGISALEELLVLRLSQNPLTGVPGNVGLITTLTELRFESTQVRKAPMSIGNLTNLRCLRMDAELMEEPCGEVCTLGLQIIIAYMQKLDTSFETKSLDINSWGITTFPTEIIGYKKPPENISLGPRIVSLNLSRNRISSLPESFAMLAALIDLDLSGNSFSRLPGAVCWLTQLEKLNMEDNFHLRRLPVELCDMRCLETLRLTNARIISPPLEVVQKLEPNDWAFCCLGVVEYMQRIDMARESGLLHLHRMGLRRFPPEVITANSVFWDFNQVRGTFITGRGQLDVLTEIRLEGNNIQVLPASIGQLTRVHFFDLTGNLLRALPASIGNMSSIETLVLSKNRLTVINDAVAHLTKMTKLQLQENELEHVTEKIGMLQNLEEISLSHNLLTYLPHSIPMITRLKNLLVSANDLQTDPSDWGVPGVSHEIGFMPNLIELNVEQNEKLQVPPRDMWMGPSSKSLEFMRLVCEARETCDLRLHDMGIRSVPNVILLMDYLVSLSLNYNNLRTIPPDISKITSLTFLEIDRNDLVVLSEDATRISNLTELRCSYNQMKALPETCNRWIRVSKIIATDNRIRHIPDGICEMPNLTELNLDRNKLKDLPEAFVLCTSLTSLKFSTEDMVKASPAHALPSGIRRVEIPCEIAIRGVDTIIEHFFNMHKAWSTYSLDLHGFGLRTLMEDVCSLTVLTHLNLGGNRLRYLPSSFTKLVDLRSVILDDCPHLEYFHHHIHVMTRLKRISIKMGTLGNDSHYPHIKMKWPPTLVTREPALMRAYLGELNGCVGHHYSVKGIKYWDTTKRLDYRFVPHDPVMDEVTTAIIPSIATRSFPHFPPEIQDLALSSLTELHIPGGSITNDMMRKQLPMITELQKLILIDQKITMICEEITMLKSLRTLTLTGNKIREIPEYLFEIVSLEKLVMIENKLSKIPPGISRLTNLQDLVLTYNLITVIPIEIGELFSLDYLVLDENRIRVIPDSIQHLTSLREFSFNDNRITRFPMSLGALTQLEILEFGSNPPISLPPTQVLNSDVEIIVGFMKRIWDCTVTHKLNFRNFQLKNDMLVEIIKEIEHVCWELNVSKNSLVSLPFELKRLTGLTTLNVSDNKYKDLNLAFHIEARERKKKDIKTQEIKAQNVYKFFEEIEMLPLYEILSNEYEIKKLNQLKPFVANLDLMDQLGLLPDEREKLLSAVALLPDAAEVEGGEGDYDDDKDEAEEEAFAQEIEDLENEEEGMDEEEAERLLQEAQGPAFKLNLDVFRQMAYDAKVAFFTAVVSAKARLAERRRRKELEYYDQQVKAKASGFKRKMRRLEEAGVPSKDAAKKKGKSKGKGKGKGSGTAEERAAKAAQAIERKEKFLAEKESKKKAKEGGLESIELVREAGGGIVQENTYSVAVFTALTDLRARRNQLVYLPEDIGDLQHLTNLDVSHNLLHWIPPSFTKLVNLKNLDIRHNQFQELPRDFGACTAIEELVLDHNRFYELPETMINMPELHSLSLDWNEFMLIPNWIDQLKKLDTLTFNHNKVKRLPNSFAHIESLTELRFTHNGFDHIPHLLTHLAKLRILDMSGNPAGALPDAMGGCPALEELYINECNITIMGVEIANCKNLRVFEFYGNDDMTYPPYEVQLKGQEGVLLYFRQLLACEKSLAMMLNNFDLSEVDPVVFRHPLLTWLDLSKNNLMKVPAELRQLQHVESLNLSRNKLGCIPRVVNLMQTLVDLAIDDNGIEVIEPSIKLLTGLKRLSLGGNHISSMHPSLFRLSSLTILNLTNNVITAVPPDIAMLDGLVTLGLGDNEIEELPDSMRYLNNLRQLVLFGNALVSLPEGFRKLWHLEVLTVSQNNLTEFPVDLASEMTSLRELWLGHNNLRSIPREIHKLVALEQLWLQDNKLDCIPQEVGLLTNLKVLTLTGNKIREIPRVVKMLKIVQNADQDKGEEYWQDPERDNFTNADAAKDEESFRSFTSTQSGRSGRSGRDGHQDARGLGLPVKTLGSPRMNRKAEAK